MMPSAAITSLEWVRVNNVDMVNYGLIGCGMMGREHIANIMRVAVQKKLLSNVSAFYFK